MNPGDDVRVNGERLRIARDHVYIALNKPVGITCTSEKSVKGNIIDLVNHPYELATLDVLIKTLTV